jgi:hypothetical protein
MGIINFISFLNPFSTTRKRKHNKIKRQKKHKRRTMRRVMRGG